MPTSMEQAAVIEYLQTHYADVGTDIALEDYFFFYDGDGSRPPDHRFPFATLVTGDHYEHVSDLDRPGVYRLNIGVKRKTYQAMFGPQPAFPKDGGAVDTGHDFTQLDEVMPHPIYAAMSWICVLSPSAETFEKVKPFLDEGYQLAVERFMKQVDRDEQEEVV